MGSYSVWQFAASMGLSTGQIAYAVWMAVIGLFYVIFSGDAVDPAALEVGSSEWAQFVKDNYSNLR